MSDKLKITLKRENGSVLLSFDKPVTWVRFTREEAKIISDTLKKKARDIEVARMEIR